MWLNEKNEHLLNLNNYSFYFLLNWDDIETKKLPRDKVNGMKEKQFQFVTMSFHFSDLLLCAKLKIIKSKSIYLSSYK